MKVMLLKRSSSFFARLLLSSLLIVALSFSFSLGVSRYVSGVLEDEISRANYAAIEQVSHIIDSWIEEILNDFSQLSLHSEVNDAIRTEIAGNELTGAQVIQVRKALTGVFNTHLDELFIYFPSTDKVVSRSRTCFPLKEYAACYYPQSADFEKTLLNTRTSSIVALKEYQSVMVLQPIPILSLPSNIAVGCAVISRNDLINLLKNCAPAGGAAFMADTAGNVLVSAGRQDIPETLARMLTDDSYGAIDISGEEYVVQKVSSKYHRLSYVSCVPDSVFYEKLISVRYACMIACVMFFVFAALIAYWLSRRNYTPISNLVNEIRSTGCDEAREYPNEIEYIRAVLRKTLDEQTGLQDVMTASVLRRMLHAQIPPGTGVKAALRDAGLSGVSDFFSVVLMQPEQNTGEGSFDELNDSAVFRLVSAIASKEDRAWTVLEHEGLYACILNTARPGENTAERFAQGVRAFFESSISLTFTLSVGGNYEGLAGIRSSFLEAREALGYRSVLGAGSVIMHSSLEKTVFRYRFIDRDEAEQLVVSAVKNSDTEPKELLSRIRTKCSDGDIRLPDEFKCFSFDICALMRKAAEKLSLSSCMIDALMVCDTLPSFEIAFQDTIERMKSAYAEGDAVVMGRSQQLCMRIKAYIDESFGDPALGISAVGSRFEMSGAYLSRLFADTVGSTIASYITSVRIENAKKMLKKETASVEVISEACGFLSSSTFIRLFKKIEGMTPGAYRKLYTCGENAEEDDAT